MSLAIALRGIIQSLVVSSLYLRIGVTLHPVKWLPNLAVLQSQNRDTYLIERFHDLVKGAIASLQMCFIVSLYLY